MTGFHSIHSHRDEEKSPHEKGLEKGLEKALETLLRKRVELEAILVNLKAVDAVQAAGFNVEVDVDHPIIPLVGRTLGSLFRPSERALRRERRATVEALAEASRDVFSVNRAIASVQADLEAHRNGTARRQVFDMEGRPMGTLPPAEKPYQVQATDGLGNPTTGAQTGRFSCEVTPMSGPPKSIRTPIRTELSFEVDPARAPARYVSVTVDLQTGKASPRWSNHPRGPWTRFGTITGTGEKVAERRAKGLEEMMADDVRDWTKKEAEEGVRSGFYVSGSGPRAFVDPQEIRGASHVPAGNHAARVAGCQTGQPNTRQDRVDFFENRLQAVRRDVRSGARCDLVDEGLASFGMAARGVIHSYEDKIEELESKNTALEKGLTEGHRTNEARWENITALQGQVARLESEVSNLKDDVQERADGEAGLARRLERSGRLRAELREVAVKAAEAFEKAVYAKGPKAMKAPSRTLELAHGELNAVLVRQAARPPRGSAAHVSEEVSR